MSTVPLTKEYFEECFFIKDGELYWSLDRPVEHFESPKRHARWYREFAGKKAGTMLKNVRRLHMKDLNIRVDRIIDILQENVRHTSKDSITFNEVFRMMNL